MSVLRELRRKLPGEDYIYFGDRKNAPYGGRQPQEILELAMKVAGRLVDRGAKALVVACNTASSVAVDQLRQRLPLPIVAIEPAVRPAVGLLDAPDAPPDAKALVIATEAMLASPRMRARLQELDVERRFLLAPCPGLVELVETGDLQSPALFDYLRRRLGSFPGEHVQVVVLGCTHYVLVREAVVRTAAEVLGCGNVIDGNCGIARQLRRVLERENLLRTTTTPGWVEVQASADLEGARRLAARVLGTQPLPAPKGRKALQTVAAI